MSKKKQFPKHPKSIRGEETVAEPVAIDPVEDEEPEVQVGMSNAERAEYVHALSLALKNDAIKAAICNAPEGERIWGMFTEVIDKEIGEILNNIPKELSQLSGNVFHDMQQAGSAMNDFRGLFENLMNSPLLSTLTKMADKLYEAEYAANNQQYPQQPQGQYQPPPQQQYQQTPPPQQQPPRRPAQQQRRVAPTQPVEGQPFYPSGQPGPRGMRP